MTGTINFFGAEHEHNDLWRSLAALLLTSVGAGALAQPANLQLPHLEPALGNIGTGLQPGAGQ
jgi:hypothetical protein